MNIILTTVTSRQLFALSGGRWRLSLINQVDFLSTRSTCAAGVNWPSLIPPSSAPPDLLHFLSQGNHDPLLPEFLDPLSDTEYLPLLPRTWGNTFNPSWSKHLIKGNKLSNFVFSCSRSPRMQTASSEAFRGGEWAHGVLMDQRVTAQTWRRQINVSLESGSAQANARYWSTNQLSGCLDKPRYLCSQRGSSSGHQSPPGLWTRSSPSAQTCCILHCWQNTDTETGLIHKTEK